MIRSRRVQSGLVATAMGALLASPCALSSALAESPLAPSSMPRIGMVDERFQSYNIEMVEVTGGHFWRPYRDKESPRKDPSMFAYRKPINLANTRLRKLAAALGPAYLRVSGTWANTTFFDDTGNLTSPPTGFNGVLTRMQWQGVIDFALAVDAKLVTSFATGAGTRDARNVWTPREARKLVAYTRALGGQIAAAEFMNEPDLAPIGGAPSDYDAVGYARDIAVFRPFLKQESPETTILGPGTAGQSAPSDPLGSEALLSATGAAFDVISFHYYGALSPRCTKTQPSAAERDEHALSEAFLTGAERRVRFYATLRDKFAPGKPLWKTETADAACGGNPWATTFLDSFRYLDQLGRMAKHGVQVMIHNTLAASDYGLLDENDFAPRPNYFMALLWRKLMGGTVLDAGVSPTPRFHLYAHCLRDRPGGVALLAINTDRTSSQALEIPTPAQRFTVTADHLTDTRVRLNGGELKLRVHDELPALEGEAIAQGRLNLAPASITFVAIEGANNPACF